MKPAGPLMVEHRLIERMAALLNDELREMKTVARVDTGLIFAGVDFFRTYADRTHHGKEEDILFKKLAAKPLSDPDREMMEHLIEDHIFARGVVGQLSSAAERYARGDQSVLPEIIHAVERLVEFYPVHIEKEDKHFFIPAMDYLSRDEQQKMLDEFREFDRKMIHEKYRAMVEQREAIRSH
jgi:hemerythrin-like domain-containing protein